MSVTQPAAAQPANTKSAKNGEAQAPKDPDWFLAGVPVENMMSPMIVGSDAMRTFKTGLRVKLGGILDGLIVESRMLLPAAVLAIKVQQSTPGERDAGTHGYAFVFGNGIVSVVK